MAALKFTPALALKAALCTVLILSVTFAETQAQKLSGQLLLEKGRVKIRRQEREIIVTEPGSRVPVQVGDVIQSDRDTRARIDFRGERDSITMMSRTSFEVRDVSPRRSFFGLNLGKAIFRAFGALRTRSFEVGTPTATIGVKGTEFVASTDGVKTFVLTLDGVVGMVSNAFPEIEVTVGKGQASSVKRGERPTPPVNVPPEQQQDIQTEDGQESFEQMDLGEPLPAGEQEDDTGTPPSGVLTTVESTQEAVEAGTEEARPSGDVGSGGTIQFGIEF